MECTAHPQPAGHGEPLVERSYSPADSKQGSSSVLDSLTKSLVAEIIGCIGYGSPLLLEKLTRLLDWPYWEVRRDAAWALGNIHRNIPDTAIQRLLELRYDSTSQAVCKAADDALMEILSLETGIEDD